MLGLPEKSRGAAASRASAIAVSEMATGVTITELRVTGESGGTSTSLGRRSPAPGQSHFIAPMAPAPAITTISAPMTILLNGHCMQGRPFLRVWV